MAHVLKCMDSEMCEVKIMEMMFSNVVGAAVQVMK